MSLKVEGKDLHAVAIERLDRFGRLIPGSGRIFHINATDSVEALNHFRVMFPNRRKHRIVGAAKCIGFFAEDDHGDKVSAT